LFLENIKEVARFFPKMKYLFAALMLDGLMLGFVASYFSHIIPESIRTSLNLGIILMVNGVGAMIGGYFSGYLSDMIRPSQLGIMGFLVILMTLLLTLLSNYI
jgi:predicted MFS family arabinose efflux permease